MCAQILHDVMQRGHDLQGNEQGLPAGQVVQRLEHDEDLRVVRDEPDIEEVLPVCRQQSTGALTKHSGEVKQTRMMHMMRQ